MRLHGRVKMGYYPTPLSVVERVRTFIMPSHEEVNFLDPCCGEGTALQALAQGFQAKTYGIELDAFRAKEAKQKLNHLLKGSCLSARISQGVFSCLFLNPPYDWEEGSEEAPSERMEKVFLRETAKYLQPRGLLIYIIPQNRLEGGIARLLAARFEDFRVYRFPAGEFEAFGQIVLFAVKKQGVSLDVPSAHMLLDAGREGHPELPHAESPPYSLPHAMPVSLFRASGVDRETLERELAASPLWSRFRFETRYTEVRRPLLPLHKGHLALLMACGSLNGIVGEGEERHVVKGKVEKFTTTSVEDKGDVIEERQTEHYRVSIKFLKPSGEILTLT